MGRYRGSITWRKSSRTVSSPQSRFGRSSFTRDLGVIWRCRGLGRTQKAPEVLNCFCFHWFASRLPGRNIPTRKFTDRRNLTPNWFSAKSVCQSVNQTLVHQKQTKYKFGNLKIFQAFDPKWFSGGTVHCGTAINQLLNFLWSVLPLWLSLTESLFLFCETFPASGSWRRSHLLSPRGPTVCSRTSFYLLRKSRCLLLSHTTFLVGRKSQFFCYKKNLFLRPSSNSERAYCFCCVVTHKLKFLSSASKHLMIAFSIQIW